jgi:hypothetical protein
MSLGPVLVIPNSLASPANTGSMATSITSSPSIVPVPSVFSYQVVWSGTSPVGAISVQGSNTFTQAADGTIGNPGTWDDLTLNYNGTAVTSIPLSGNTGSGLIDITVTAIYAVRLVYTRTSGTGTLAVTAFGRGY